MYDVTDRLSSASVVCCAAAVGGEKAAAFASSPGLETTDNDTAGGCQGGRGSSTGNLTISGALGEFNDDVDTLAISNVVEELTRKARVPDRKLSAPLYFAFDHCFSVRGVGTVLTGTVLAGQVQVRVRHCR